MRKVFIVTLAAMLYLACEGFTQVASADGMGPASRTKKVRSVHERPRYVGCPDRYSCYSLYGAYGPWGGPAYWSRYSYEGWYLR